MLKLRVPVNMLADPSPAQVWAHRRTGNLASSRD